MTDYGVQPEGYIPKPLSVFLAELEADIITEFGTGVIQTPQSPLGQLNAFIADILKEIDERNLDLYQSYDPDQAESTRLETLARLRLIKRNGQADSILRQAITNEGQARVDMQDIEQAVKNVDGVTDCWAYVNESGETTNFGLDSGFVAVAVIGGDDGEVADAVRQHVVPGINTYGNTSVNSLIGGRCRTLSIIRPTVVDVDLHLQLKLGKSLNNCPPPALSIILENFVAIWNDTVVNGQDFTSYTIRDVIERNFESVELVSFSGSRDGIQQFNSTDIEIAFTEIGKVSIESVTGEVY